MEKKTSMKRRSKYNVRAQMSLLVVSKHIHVHVRVFLYFRTCTHLTGMAYMYYTFLLQLQ